MLARFPHATKAGLFAVNQGARYADWLRGSVIAEISCHLKRIDRLLHFTGCRTLYMEIVRWLAGCGSGLSSASSGGRCACVSAERQR